MVKFFALVSLISCSAAIHGKDEIESAMKHYDHLIQKMDADSIALCYRIDGELGNVAHGRDSIKHFLERFNNFHVLSQESTTNSINIFGDSAIQKGIYHQVTISPKGDTLRVSGEYEASWMYNASEGWRLKKMVTNPL